MRMTPPDGRTLGYEIFGPEDGDPVVAIHGTPGSRLASFPIGDPYTEAAVRVLRFDRGGYGLSTRVPGRSVADGAADVAALADHLAGTDSRSLAVPAVDHTPCPAARSCLTA
jgi:pimeloyl-ACP methyl ester carboxylesterase